MSEYEKKIDAEAVKLALSINSELERLTEQVEEQAKIIEISEKLIAELDKIIAIQDLQLEKQTKIIEALSPDE